MSVYQRIAMNLGATEPVNGSWIQAIAQEYGVMNPVNGSWIQAIANSLGATDAVNGSWFQAIANQLGTYTLTDNPTWLEEWAKLTELPPVAPVADFMTSNTNPVENVEIQFIDLTLNIPTSWLWNFGDGTTSTSKNPKHTYTVVGDYTVSLTVTNVAGSDTETKVDYITVAEAPVEPLIPTTGLIAYYPLDGSGDDFYGNYDLTISNPDIIDDIDGKFDGGAYFPTDNINGATGNSTMSINGNLDNLRMPFSVSMWVKPTASLTFLFTINGESAAGGKGVSAYIAAAGQIVLEYHDGGPNGLESRKTFATSSGLITPNVWSHVVIYVEDIDTNKVYVNGDEINIKYSNGEATEVVWGDNSSIGSRLNYLGHQISKDLYVDDVSIWEREITATEAVALATNNPLIPRA